MRRKQPPKTHIAGKSEWLKGVAKQKGLDYVDLSTEPEPCPYCGSTTKTHDPYRGYDACDGCGVI